MEKTVLKRPGRKVAAEKRRVARLKICKFAKSREFHALPRDIQVAILTLCPEAKEEADRCDITQEVESYSSILYSRKIAR